MLNIDNPKIEGAGPPEYRDSPRLKDLAPGELGQKRGYLHKERRVVRRPRRCIQRDSKCQFTPFTTYHELGREEDRTGQNDTGDN